MRAEQRHHNGRLAIGSQAQFRQLQQTLSWAYQNSYHYHQLLSDAPITTWADFAQISLTDYSTLLSDDLSQTTADWRRQALTIKTSQGIRWLNGTMYQQAVQWWTDHLKMVKPKQKVLLAMACNKDSYAAIIDAAIKQRQGISLPLGPVAGLKRWVERIIAENVTTIIGNPYALLALAQYCQVNNLSVPIQNVILPTDYTVEDIGVRIIKYWNCHVWIARTINDGLYTIGWGSLKSPIKINSQYLCEVIAPDGLDELPSNQYGPLVITALYEQVRPLIRYQTGRFTRLLPTKTDQLMDAQIRYWPLCSCDRQAIDEAIYQIEQVYDYEVVEKQGHWYFTLYALYDVYFSTSAIAQMLRQRLRVAKVDVRLEYRPDIDGPIQQPKIIHE